MGYRKLLAGGLAGTGIVALCCFTPILVIALGTVGLAAWAVWLDFVLLPLLAAFLALTVVAALRLMRRGSGEGGRS